MTKVWFEVAMHNNKFVVKEYEICKRNKSFVAQSRDFDTEEAATKLLIFKVRFCTKK